MFINDKIAYLQLQKTAGTHIASVLHSLAPGQFRAKHSPLLEDVGDRLVVGSVRSPWDWYVSQWAYGCLARGSIYAQLTHSFPAITYRMARAAILHPNLWSETLWKIIFNASKDPREWIKYYNDANDPLLFRAWLKGILSEKGKRFLMENYPVLPLRKFAGLMTFRFLQLHVAHSRWRQSAAKIRCKNALRDLYREHGIVDRFVRVERLESDLGRILDDVGILHTADNPNSRKRTNSSQRREAGYYYDDDTIELVRVQDFLIVDEFGYEPPELETSRAFA